MILFVLKDCFIVIDLLITGGIVCTVDKQRSVINNGAVAVDNTKIIDVGATDKLESEYDSKQRIDASGSVVLPGFISTHVHVADILVRGLGADRDVYDWLANVKAATSVMETEEHEIAAALYCLEAMQSGITTFVENVTGAGTGFVSSDGPSNIVDAKMNVYDRAGIRNIWAQGIVDRSPGEDVLGHFEQMSAKEPSATGANRDKTEIETETALDRTESLIETYHGTADGRQSVWPAPYEFNLTSPALLEGSYELAEKYDVMTTTHSSVTDDRFQPAPGMSDIEYANSCHYLGERTLLGHCVRASDRDIRLLSATDTAVAHNIATNLALGDGFAPIPAMIKADVTVAMGTDNTSASDTVNMINDMRLAATVHAGNTRDPGAITAEKTLEMATIDAARAIGREDDLGSIETGKLADLVIIDLDQPHLTPHSNIPSAVVYQAQGADIDTVVCNGEVVLKGRKSSLIEEEYPDLVETALVASQQVADRAGISHLQNRTWQSMSSQ